MSAADKTKLDGVATSATANPSAPALTGSTNNTITTVTGANAIQGEANLTFDGNNLKVTAGSEGFSASLQLIADEGDDAADNWRLLSNASDNALTVSSSESTERLRIDSSGRIGVGKTPASYHSNNKAVITGDSGYAIYGRGSDTLIISQNHYYDSSDVGKYVADGEGTFYRQANGVHEFWTAGSGSADAGISLAEKVRIQNGGGISFNGDTAAANALDDYEEGTFTPTIRANLNSNGSANGTGSYVKVGKKVHIHVNIGNKTLTSFPGSGPGTIRIDGLPFASNQANSDEMSVSSKCIIMGVDNNSNNIYFRTYPSQSYLLGYYNADGSTWVASDAGHWDNSGVYCIFTMTYFTNS